MVMFFLLFIMLLFVFPYLLLPFGAFFVILIMFLPFKFTFDSIVNLIAVPSQIYKIATNPDLRKNHGLEHATANILEKEYGYQNLAGYARENGFYIIGAHDVWEVEQAARKGLTLMKRGYDELAVHKKCGTSITVVNFISAIIFLLLLFSTGYFSIINMLIAILLANLTGPVLGEVVQKYFTTSGKVAEMEIDSAYVATGNIWGAQPKVFVKTRRIPFVS
ncbi:MAG: DUF6391 domain-containing protein [Halanaerobiaceae bacterium]